MSDITVLQRTQIITVDPASNSISITNAGPMGPRGPEGTGILDSIVAGDNVLVDPTDIHNPIVSVVIPTDTPPNPHAASHGNGGSDEVSLDGSQITTGTVADARIASTITRDSELTAGLATKAATSHTHTQANVTGLTAALAAKANVADLGTAAAADITDFDAAGAATAAVETANAYTDAAILEVEIAGGGVVDSIVPGPGISINNTDPANPIITALAEGGGGASWGLQRYFTVDDARMEADHVIWYPDEPGLGDPNAALDDHDLIFRDGPGGGGGGGGTVMTIVAGTGIEVDDTDPENPIVSGAVVDATTVATAGALMRAGGNMTGDINLLSGAVLAGPSGGLLGLVAPGAGGEIRLIINGSTRLLINETSISLPGSMQFYLAVNPFDPMHAVPLQYLQANYQLKYQAFNNQTDTAHTLVLTDAGGIVLFDNAGACTLTVPQFSDVAFPTGTSIDIIQFGIGQVTVVAGTGVTLHKSMPTAKTRAQYSVFTLILLGSNHWLLTGDAAET